MWLRGQPHQPQTEQRPRHRVQQQVMYDSYVWSIYYWNNVYNLRECSLLGGGGGGGQMEGRQEIFIPLFRGGGGRNVLLWIWEEGWGGQKRLKVDIISFRFFRPEPHEI